MSSGWFITGTDTGIGKTALTAALTAAARSRGLDAIPMKPVQTGAGSETPGAAPDMEFCVRMAHLNLAPQVRRDIAPYCFLPACSPHLASSHARRPIDTQVILRAFDRLQQQFFPVFVEGAGGVCVPLNPPSTMLDLMHSLALPVLVASRPGLGTINHTLLTVAALREKGLTVDGIVFVQTAPTEWGEIETENRSCIERLANVSVLGIIPYIEALESAPEAPSALLLSGGLLLDRLLLGRDRR